MEGRSRACYLADDQVEAIRVVSDAIALRRLAGSPQEQARAIAELTDYLLCRGRYSEAESCRGRRPSDSSRISPKASATAQVLALRAQLVWTDDTETALAMCRDAESIAVAHDDEVRSGDGTSVDRHARAAPRPVRGASTARGSRGRLFGSRAEGRQHERSTISAHTALSSTTTISLNEFLTAALEYCVDNTLDLWRIQRPRASGALPARSRAVDRGRRHGRARSWRTRATSRRGHSSKRSSCSLSSAHGVAIRGSSTASRRGDLHVGLSPGRLAVIVPAPPRVPKWHGSRVDRGGRSTRPRRELELSRKRAGVGRRLAYWPPACGLLGRGAGTVVSRLCPRRERRLEGRSCGVGTAGLSLRAGGCTCASERRRRVAGGV